jgi:hypothetical protein
MKIGCDACGRAEATVLCCADEAALCGRCDAAVHSANKLAGRHHRVALLPPYTPDVVVEEGDPVCDICQVTQRKHSPAVPFLFSALLYDRGSQKLLYELS